MLRVLHTYMTFIAVLLLFCQTSSAEAQNSDDLLYSITTTWNTAGQHELLARKTTVIKNNSTDSGKVISFGNTLGDTPLVNSDKGVTFMRSVKQAGIDYIIPAKNEFIHGVGAFRMLTAYPGMPDFISANIVDERTRHPILRPYTVFNTRNMRILVIGVSDPNIINDSADENVMGLDVMPIAEVLQSIENDIIREYPDLVILAGRLDRESVSTIAHTYSFIDVFITNYSAGGFSDAKKSVSTVLIADKPVYVVSESGTVIGRLTSKYTNGYDVRELTEFTVDDNIKPDEGILGELVPVVKDIERKIQEEKTIVHTGRAVADVLVDVFDVDAAVIERDNLYYYPLKDSLTLLDVRKIIKPERRLTTVTLKGSYLKNLHESGRTDLDPARRLHFGGITDDGKIDDLPIQDDAEYTIITTPFLRSGGHDYEALRHSSSERVVTVDMLDVAEDYLVAKDRRLRDAAKQKIWSLSLNLSVGSNMNKTQVDTKKDRYGSAPPKEFRNLSELFTGFFEVSSWDDRFNLKYKQHVLESRLRARYMRSGLQTDEGTISYKEGRDELQLFNKYTYDLTGFKSKPFAALDVYSELYSPTGTHPVSASARTGLSREIKSLWNMVVEVGVDGTRNYLTNENSFGSSGKAILSKSFPSGGLFTTPTKLSMDAQVTWNPMAKYHMAFFMRNNNRIDFQLMKKFNLTVNIKSYAYRDTRLRKLAMGFIYDLSLNYRMDWKI